MATGTIAVRPGGRLVHLDRLKILLTAGVITAHAAMSYGAAGTWLYEEGSLSDGMALILSVLVGGGVMFVLGLFFLMSGMLTTGPLQRRGPRRFLLSRLVRLGIPVLAYALVVWPMLEWLVDRVRSEAPSLWEFYRFEFSAGEWTSRGTGPMWFVAILLVVTVVWCVWRWRFPASTPTTPAGTTVAIAAVAVAVGTFVVRTRFPVDSAQFLDVHVWIWPQSLSLFVLGAVGAERGWISPVPRSVLSWCRWAVLGAVLLLALLILLSHALTPSRAGGTGRPPAWPSARVRSRSASRCSSSTGHDATSSRTVGSSAPWPSRRTAPSWPKARSWSSALCCSAHWTSPAT